MAGQSTNLLARHVASQVIFFNLFSGEGPTWPDPFWTG